MSARQLVRQCEASTRVAAPVDQVWAEVGSLAQVLRHSYGITDFEPAADGNSAKVRGSLAWGPLRWKLNGSAAVRSVDPGRYLEWVGEATQIAFQIICKLQLDKVAADETAVRFEAVGSTPRRSPVQAGLWNVLSAELETYVAHFVDRVGTLSEQHTRARRQLGGDSTDSR